jgi:hypothetical protein
VKDRREGWMELGREGVKEKRTTLVGCIFIPPRVYFFFSSTFLSSSSFSDAFFNYPRLDCLFFFFPSSRPSLLSALFLEELPVSFPCKPSPASHLPLIEFHPAPSSKVKPKPQVTSPHPFIATCL